VTNADIYTQQRHLS